MFTIFYSWQSDLPGNQCKNFIRNCIDAAVREVTSTEALEAIRDEATKGLTGAPDIVSSIIKKIDNCDLFVADVSLCYKCSQNEKMSPNPNVMVELGYAAKVLGWERIICIANEDYGKELPFDVAHNRVNFYSLVKQEKVEVKKSIASILAEDIRTLMSKKPRAKDGRPMFVLGTYDFSTRKVTEDLVPFEIGQSAKYIQHNEALLKDSYNCYRQLVDLNHAAEERKRIEELIQEQSENELETGLLDTYSGFSELAKSLESLTKFPTAKTTEPVSWTHTDRDINLIKKWLGEDVSEDFFDLGDLSRSILALPGYGSRPLEGSDEEKNKYNLLCILHNNLTRLEIRSEYKLTFDNAIFIPIALQNVSNTKDEHIRIVIRVECGKLINPDRNLIHDACPRCWNIICKDYEEENDIGVIGELLQLPCDDVIQADESFADTEFYMPRPFVHDGLLGYKRPDKTDNDYENEIRHYLASPAGENFYEFNIASLRANECVWLSGGILLQPVDGNVQISYQIHSDYSSGNITGRLFYQGDREELE